MGIQGCALLCLIALGVGAFAPIPVARHTAYAAGATLFLNPDGGSFVADSTFDMAVQVDTGGQAINAVLVDLKFPADKLQIVRPAQTSSFVSVWIAQPTYSNAEGTINLQGGAPSPGLNDAAGTILTFTFRAREAGEATVSFEDSSKVYANDGRGTNILSARRDSTFTITPKPPEGPIVSSTTHPDQNKWYQNRTPQFTWKAEQTPQALSWTIDHNPSSQPDVIAEKLEPIIAPTVDSDGVWFFHLRAQANGVWGGTTHYTAQIDMTPPAQFKPLVQSSRAVSDDRAVADTEISGNQKEVAPINSGERAIASFATTDTTSGIERYEVQLVGLTGKWNLSANFTEGQSPYTLPALPVGKYKLIIRAVDKAGNSTDAQTEFEVVPAGEKLVSISLSQLPLWARWALGVVLLGLLILAVVFIVRYIRRRREFAARYPHYVYPYPMPPAPTGAGVAAVESHPTHNQPSTEAALPAIPRPPAAEASKLKKGDADGPVE